MTKPTISDEIRKCKVEECERKHFSNGFCRNHYAKFKRVGVVGKKEKCSVNACDGFVYSKGLCERHYQQNKSGKGIRRTRRDPNLFWTDGDVCFIQIYDKNGKAKHVAYIDKEDYERCKSHKWFSNITSSGVWYISTMAGRKAVSLHRFLLGNVEPGFEIDHINRNTFDNRKSNLRVCTRAENVCNVAKAKNKSSVYKGVSYNKDTGRWMGCIRKAGTLNYLGLFDTELQAAIAYNDAARRLHGEFAYLNNVYVGD